LRRIKGRVPSPAIVISIAALVFAVAGTALAGVATVSVLSKKEKKQTRNIAGDEIKKAAPGLSVANAAQLAGKPSGDYALAHSRGVALAGAKIESNGSVLTWFNTLGGVPSVSKFGAGSYDITVPGVDKDQTVILGTVAGPGEIGVATGSGGIEVSTFTSAGAYSDHQFSIVVYGASSGG
jgi:hypothetical protein